MLDRGLLERRAVVEGLGELDGLLPAVEDALEALATLLAVYVGFARASVGIEVIREELARLESANE